MWQKEQDQLLFETPGSPSQPKPAPARHANANANPPPPSLLSPTASHFQSLGTLPHVRIVYLQVATTFSKHYLFNDIDPFLFDFFHFISSSLALKHHKIPLLSALP